MVQLEAEGTQIQTHEVKCSKSKMTVVSITEALTVRLNRRFPYWWSQCWILQHQQAPFNVNWVKVWVTDRSVCVLLRERDKCLLDKHLTCLLIMFFYREINKCVTPCVHQDSSKAVSLGLWMEEMIFNLADSRLFFNDLEVSRFITRPQSEQHRSVLLWKPVSNRRRVSFPLQLECFPSIYFSPKAYYCIELHNLPLVSTFSPIAP